MNIPDKEWLPIGEAVGLLAYETACSGKQLMALADADRGVALRAAVKRLKAEWVSGRLRVEAGPPFAMLDGRLAELKIDPFNNTVGEESAPQSYVAADGTTRVNLNPRAPNPGFLDEAGNLRIKPPPKVHVSAADFRKCFASERQAKRGAPPKVDWEIVKRHFFWLMDEYGDFIPSDRKWNVQAKAVEALLEYCQNELSADVSSTPIKKRIGAWLVEWRAVRKG